MLIMRFGDPPHQGQSFLSQSGEDLRACQSLHGIVIEGRAAYPMGGYSLPSLSTFGVQVH